jgi:AcrR family transcriptional regulator
MIDLKNLTEKQLKRYERILNLAEELVYQNGFYKLSLTELTEHLKVSRSTIYDHFGSKEGLIEIIVDRYDKKLDEGLLEIVEAPWISTYDKFIKVAKQLAKSVEGRNSYRFLKDLQTHAPELYDTYLQGRKSRVEYCYKPLIKLGIKDQLFDPNLKPDFLLQTYLKLTQMVCDTDIVEKSSINKTEAMNTIIKIFLNGAKQLN